MTQCLPQLLTSHRANSTCICCCMLTCVTCVCPRLCGPRRKDVHPPHHPAVHGDQQLHPAKLHLRLSAKRSVQSQHCRQQVCDLGVPADQHWHLGWWVGGGVDYCAHSRERRNEYWLGSMHRPTGMGQLPTCLTGDAHSCAKNNAALVMRCMADGCFVGIIVCT